MNDVDQATALNDQLVDRLVEDGAIQGSRIEEAFRGVLRHWFVLGVPLEDVYRDAAVVTSRSGRDPSTL